MISGGSQNPMALVFSCFLPAALWTTAQQQTRDAQEIHRLKARIDQLEKAHSSSALSKLG